jgi:hypothetical protein
MGWDLSALELGHRWQIRRMEHSVEWELAGETEVVGENLPQWLYIVTLSRGAGIAQTV